MDMRADHEAFRRDLTRAEQVAHRAAGGIRTAFQGMGSGIGSVINSVSSLQSALFAAAGAGGIGLIIRQSLAAADDLDEMSSRIGIGVEALQELQHGAKLSGISTQDLETALRNLNRRIGESAAGQGEAVKLFRDLGFSAIDSAGRMRTVEQVLGDFADKIAATQSPAERTRLAMEAFGRSGTLLLPMLAKGRAGLAEFAEEARRLGVVLDEGMVRQAVEAKDRLDRLSAVIQTNLTRAILALEPQITKVVELLAQAAAGWAHLLDVFSASPSASTDELTRRLADARQEARALREDLRQAAGQGGSIGPSAAITGKGIEAALILAEGRVRELEGLLSKKLRTETRSGARGGAAGAPVVSTEQLTSLDAFRRKLVDLAVVDPTAKALLDVNREAEKLKASAPGLAEEIDKVVVAMGKLISNAARLKTEAADLEAFRGVGELFGEGTPSDVQALIDEAEVWSKLGKSVHDAQVEFAASGDAMALLEAKVRVATAALVEMSARFGVSSSEASTARDRLDDVRRAAEQFAASQAAMQFAVPPLDPLIAEADIWAKLAAARREANLETLATGQALPGLQANIAATTAALKAMADAFGDDSEQVKHLKRELADLTISESARLVTDSFKRIDAQSMVVGSSFDATTAKIETLRDAMVLMIVAGADPASARVAELKRQLDGLEKIQGVKDVLSDVFGSLSSTISTSVQGIIQGTQTVEQAFANMGQNIAASLVESVVNRGLKAVEKALLKFVDLVAEVGLSAALGIRPAATTTTTTPTIAPDTGGSVAFAQHGGIFTRPTLTMIGEAGPEAVIPLAKLGGASATIREVIQGTQTFEEVIESIAQSIVVGLIEPVISVKLEKIEKASMELTDAAQPGPQPEIALQQGGVVSRPTRALIGEAGPEAVIPLDRWTELIADRGAAPRREVEALHESALAFAATVETIEPAFDSMRTGEAATPPTPALDSMRATTLPTPARAATSPTTALDTVAIEFADTKRAGIVTRSTRTFIGGPGATAPLGRAEDREMIISQDIQVLEESVVDFIAKLEAADVGVPAAEVPVDDEFDLAGVDAIHPMQRGGIVTRPTRALIGEAGPEAVVPLDRWTDVVADRGVAPQREIEVLRESALTFAATVEAVEPALDSMRTVGPTQRPVIAQSAISLAVDSPTSRMMPAGVHLTGLQAIEESAVEFAATLAAMEPARPAALGPLSVIDDDDGGFPMQRGGVVTKPTRAMIGEAGPEAVIPFERLGQGGGPMVEVTIINQAPRTEIEQRQQTGPDGRAIYEFIIRSIEDAAGRGRLDRTFGANWGVTRKGVRR